MKESKLNVLQITIPTTSNYLVERCDYILLLINSLKRSIKISKYRNKWKFRIILAVNDEYFDDSVKEIFTDVDDIIYFGNIGKIGTINFVINNYNVEGNLFIDDDILVPVEFIDEVITYLSSSISRTKFLCFKKYSTTNNLVTDFQKMMSFYYSPSLQRRMALFIPGYKLRPTGSCYVISSFNKFNFPDPCNETEILFKLPHVLSTLPVKTYYTGDISDEIRRKSVQYDTHLRSIERNPTSYRNRSYDMISASISLLSLSERLNLYLSEILNTLQYIITKSVTIHDTSKFN